MDFIEQVAESCVATTQTFRVDGDEELPLSLSNYLFKEKLDDAVVLCDMPHDRGYKMPRKLSEADAAYVTKWVKLVSERGAEIQSVNEFVSNFNALSKMLDKKGIDQENKSLQDKTASDIVELQNGMLDDFDATLLKLEQLKLSDATLRKQLTPIELMFETEDFTCVNAKGESKSIKELVEGKTHILVYFSAHWCPPCR